MAKYALVVTDSGYIYGVNALINSLKYYGNEVTFHHLYWGEEAEAWSKAIQNSGKFDFKSINLEKLSSNPDYPKRNGSVRPAWFCKFYRYFYCALELSGKYDAICIMDADMMVTSNIMAWFEVAACSDKLIMPNNDMSAQEHDSYIIDKIGSGASPPLHNMPLFFRPSSKINNIFLSMISIHEKRQVSDMSSLNHAIIEAGYMNNVLALPNLLWLISVAYNVRLTLKEVGGRKQLMLHKTGDRINSVHKPWWIPQYCKKLIEGCSNEMARDIALNNLSLFWDLLCFFNTELYHKIPWEIEFPEVKAWQQ